MRLSRIDLMQHLKFRKLKSSILITAWNRTFPENPMLIANVSIFEFIFTKEIYSIGF